MAINTAATCVCIGATTRKHVGAMKRCLKKIQNKHRYSGASPPFGQYLNEVLERIFCIIPKKEHRLPLLDHPVQDLEDLDKYQFINEGLQHRITQQMDRTIGRRIHLLGRRDKNPGGWTIAERNLYDPDSQESHTLFKKAVKHRSHSVLPARFQGCTFDSIFIEPFFRTASSSPSLSTRGTQSTQSRATEPTASRPDSRSRYSGSNYSSNCGSMPEDVEVRSLTSRSSYDRDSAIGMSDSGDSKIIGRPPRLTREALEQRYGQTR